MGPLPQTRKWLDIIDLVAAGAGAGQVANATLRALESGLNAARNDPGVLESAWLLTQLPLAANKDDFVLALTRCGLSLPASPGLLDLVAAVSDAVDAKTPNNVGRTDLGEMAQASATEALVGVVGRRLKNLFGATPEDVRTTLAGFDTPKQFGILARDFFGRFVRKCLMYALSKGMAGQTGERGRFATVAAQARFTDALDTHCREAAAIVQTFAGEWFSKTEHRTEAAIGRETAAGFVAHAMTKLIAEFKRRGGHGN
jgi:hypothetical protein